MENATSSKAKVSRQPTTQATNKQGNEMVSIGREPGAHNGDTQENAHARDGHGGTQNKPPSRAIENHRMDTAPRPAYLEGAHERLWRIAKNPPHGEFVCKRWAKEGLQDRKNRHKQDGNKVTKWSASN